jgi:hypothetical protein
MNKIILAMAFTFILVLTGWEACFGYTAHLAWNTVDDVRVAGYKVHYQMDSDVPPFNGTGAKEIDLPGQRATPNTIISGLDPAHSYSFAVTSYISVNNVKIESVYSNIVTVPVLPTISITAPGANSKVGGTVQVTATASAGTYAVDLFVDGNLLISRLTAPPYTHAWDTSTLDHGPYSLSAKAYYSPASSIAGESATVSVTVVKAKNQRTGDYYETLQQAYDDASEDDTLMLWSSDSIVENILCGQQKLVTIKGGYDQGFPLNNAGYTAFSGSFTIGRGKVILDRLVIF